MSYHVHSTDEDYSREILAWREESAIGHVVHDDRHDRPGELEDRRDVYWHRAQSTVVDIHSEESSRERDREEIEPLFHHGYSESLCPSRDEDESDPDHEHRESKSEHRDDFGMVVFEEVFREIGRCSPCCSGDERVEYGFALTRWSHGDTVRERDEVSR